MPPECNKLGVSIKFQRPYKQLIEIYINRMTVRHIY